MAGGRILMLSGKVNNQLLAAIIIVTLVTFLIVWINIEVNKASRDTLIMPQASKMTAPAQEPSEDQSSPSIENHAAPISADQKEISPAAKSTADTTGKEKEIIYEPSIKDNILLQ